MWAYQASKFFYGIFLYNFAIHNIPFMTKVKINKKAGWGLFDQNNGSVQTPCPVLL